MFILTILPVLYIGVVEAISKTEIKPIVVGLSPEFDSLNCSFIEQKKYCNIEDKAQYCYLTGEVANIPKPIKIKPKNIVVAKVKEAKTVTDNSQTINSASKGRLSRGGVISQSNSISMTDDERYWLEKLVEAESANEPYLGKLAVANVIANRVLDDDFPNTVDGVIRQPGQYSPWEDGSIYKRTASADTKKAISEVFNKGNRVIPKETMYFMATYVNNNWMDNTRIYIKTIGGHKFYSKYAK